MFIRTAASFRQGARHAARARYYTSHDIFAAEQETIFGCLWNGVGRTSDLARPGDYVVRTVADESIIVVRGRDEVIRAFFNVCRHRGTRLCSDEAGRFGDVIRCPYHAWTYAIDGRLIGAPHMQDVEGFDQNDYPLHRAAVAESSGFLFVNVARRHSRLPDGLRPSRNASIDSLSPLFGPSTAPPTTCAQTGSWCSRTTRNACTAPSIHPELSSRIPYQSAANDLTDGPFLGGYLELAADHESVTVSGRSCAPHDQRQNERR